ncbi:MAG: AraC family transcriptional regulator [Calditrichia bacterium]
MKHNVKDMHFKKQTDPDLEFQILSLNDLFRRTLDHSLDRPHRLQFYLILLITKGTGKHFIDFETYHYEPGTIFFISKYQIQYFDVQPENDGLMILFTEEFLYEAKSELKKLQKSTAFDFTLYSPQILLKGENKVEFLRAIEDISLEYQKQNDFAKTEILQCLLKLLILKSERLRKNDNTSENISSDLRHFIKLVDENYTRRHHVVEYADMMSRSPKTLSKMTVKVFNKTAKEFIDARIILEAKRLLTHTTLSVKQLAFQLGFSEPTNFVKFFKSRVKMSPKQFRNSHQ